MKHLIGLPVTVDTNRHIDIICVVLGFRVIEHGITKYARANTD